MREKTVKSVFVPLSIEENYEDYKEQISEDTEIENEEETKIMLRDAEVQSLFKGYEFQERGHLRKKSTRTTNYTDSEQISLRGSGK